ncbi:MAG: ATP-grasp domain-containing protein [Candidatus Helarchaeota archaeon]
MNIVAVDYWGDQDLIKLTKNVKIVKKRGNQSNLDKGELLVKEAKKTFNKNQNIDGIVIGSGLDDRPDLWEELNSLAPVYGNSPPVLKRARSVLNLFEEVKRKKISCPVTRLVTTEEDAVKATMDINLPVVLKPMAGAGGVNIRIAYNKEQLKYYYNEIRNNTKNEQVLIQEYIKGVDISSMTLSSDKEHRILSINKQLIGVKEVRAPSNFSYCGNFIPFKTTENVSKNIESASEKIAQLLGLKGINGTDFVLKEENPFLMEVNPRFPGTFELVENILEVNLLKIHINACKGKLPLKRFPYLKYGLKFIVFSDGEHTLPELSSIENLYDIPFPGTKVNKGSPICTIQTFGSSPNQINLIAKDRIKEIYSLLKDS